MFKSCELFTPGYLFGSLQTSEGKEVRSELKGQIWELSASWGLGSLPLLDMVSSILIYSKKASVEDTREP